MRRHTAERWRSAAVTVAVLACGVDVAYPVAHTNLLAAVAGAGVVVSELPPGSHPTRTRFLERNRVIAALTRGTVVVEAAIRSGARNTAGHADRLSRVVMAVPGPVTSASSAGCHRMVREEGAVLVTNAGEVVDAVGTLGDDATDAARGEERPHDGLDPVALRVLEALPIRRWAPPDAVGRTAGLDPPSVLRALGRLGIGRTRRHEGRRLAPRTHGPDRGRPSLGIRTADEDLPVTVGDAPGVLGAPRRGRRRPLQTVPRGWGDGRDRCGAAGRDDRVAGGVRASPAGRARHVGALGARLPG